MRWSWSEATELHPLWTLRGLERRLRATPLIRIIEGFAWLMLQTFGVWASVMFSYASDMCGVHNWRSRLGELPRGINRAN